MKKVLSLILALVMLSTVLFGCGNSNSSAADEGSAAEGTTNSDASAAEAGNGDEEPVTIEVAVSGSAQEMEIHQQKFDLYMEEHPNVTIKPVDIGTERFQKLMTLIGSGTAPDIIYINEWCYSLAYRDVLLPLDSYIEADTEFDLADYPESLLVPLRYEDQLYALPQEVSPLCRLLQQRYVRGCGLGAAY